MSTLLERILQPVTEIPKGATIQAPPAQYEKNPNLRENDEISVPSFPMDCLPPRIRRIVQDAYDYLSFPPDFTAAGILAATAMAIGRTHRLQYIGDWNETSCIYMAFVAPPGTAKSHPLSFALKPIMEANKKAIKDYHAHKAALEAAESTSAPTDRQCLYSDFTIEALVKAAQNNKRGVGVYNDELRAFFNNMGRYNTGSEGEFWLQNWSNISMTFTRMTRKVFIPWPAISIVGTIQPSLLEEIGKNGRANNGFVERMLFVYPDNVPVIPLRKRSQRSDTAHIIAKNYLPIMQVLLDRDLLLRGGDDEEDIPHELIFEPDADDFITDFINDLKVTMEKEDNEYKRNVYSKMQNYCLRFSMLIHMLEYACACQDNGDFPPSCDLRITIKQADKACALAQYFIKHAMKTHNAVNGATPMDKLPKDQKNWYKALPFGSIITTKVAEEIAVKHNMSRAGMYRLLNEGDPHKKLFQKVRHGEYERIYC